MSTAEVQCCCRSTRQEPSYTAKKLRYFAKASSSIKGIECEHRVLGNVIANTNPSNRLNHESTDGIQSVYNGAKSAFAAPTPFVTPSTGPGYLLQDALTGAATVGIIVPGAPPTM